VILDIIIAGNRRLPRLPRGPGPQLESVPVVFLTGRLESQSSGAALRVNRPFTASELLAVVGDVLVSAAVGGPGSQA
jgi:hypothetical protein